MKRQVRGIVRLTRFREYVGFVVVSTLIGAATAHGTFGWKLIAVLMGNWLAVGFAFMYNDVEDAPDDRLNPAKAHRNPVSAGDLPVRTALICCLCVAIMAALFFGLLGIWPFLAGLACLLLAYLYSWRGLRLKIQPGWDLISHALMLAGLQFLTSYLTFAERHDWNWIYPFTFVVALSMYGELFNEMRDMDGDMRAGLRHTASVLGPTLTQNLMLTLIAWAVLSAAITILVVRLIPNWVLIVIVALEAVFNLPAAWAARRKQSAMDLQAPFHMPAQHAGAIALLIWFVGTWANGLLRAWGLRPF